MIVRSVHHRIPLVLLACCAIALFALPAHAQEASAATSSPANTSPAPANAPAAGATAGNGLTKEQQTRLTNLAANISNRIEAATSRLDNIAGRLESRAAKIDAQTGKHPEDVHGTIGNATTTLGSIRSEMNEVDARVQNAVAAPEPVHEWVAIRDLYLKVQSQLQFAKTQLQHSIELMENNAKPQDQAAGTGTSTANTSSL